MNDNAYQLEWLEVSAINMGKNMHCHLFTRAQFLWIAISPCKLEIQITLSGYHKAIEHFKMVSGEWREISCESNITISVFGQSKRN